MEAFNILGDVIMCDERGSAVKGNSPFSLPFAPPSKHIYIGNTQYNSGEFPMGEIQTVQTKLDLSICEMCGRICRLLNTHHIIPRWLGGTDEYTMQICHTCHRKADSLFLQFVFDAHGERGYGHHPEKPELRRPIGHCDVCNKFITYRNAHHTLPIFMGGSDDDVIYVCPTCHAKADRRFLKLILNPNNIEGGYGTKWSDPTKKHSTMMMKQLNSINVDDNVRICICVLYNKNKDYFTIGNYFRNSYIRKEIRRGRKIVV
jgi:hypothetical protein